MTLAEALLAIQEVNELEVQYDAARSRADAMEKEVKRRRKALSTEINDSKLQNRVFIQDGRAKRINGDWMGQYLHVDDMGEVVNL